MRLLIFGATGFIGSHLTRIAETEGYDVVALSRSGKNPGGAGETYRWQLGDLAPAQALSAGSCAIHLAHDFGGAAGARLTVDATLTLMMQLRLEGVERQIFFSSYSAGPQARSIYGLTKLQIERGIAGCEDIIIVRPGLVLGSGGIYGRLRKWARQLPIIPLPDGGRGLVPIITIEDLCTKTLIVARLQGPDREFNLFEPKLRSLHHLIQDAAAEAGRKPWVMPIPSALILAGLRAAEMFHLPLPINADSLNGFLANQTARHVSDMERICQ